ncbi:MAG: ribonuclease H-like domain-containing protein [Rudaea sp.]|nr:ribonuclease H-like domain-containing protein [Rudaea sp.]
MSTVSERLRTLQRQIGRAADQPPALGLRNELRRLMRRRERSSFVPLPAPAGVEIAPGLRLVEQCFPTDALALRSVRLPWGDPIDVDRQRLVCFDTETTGLAGGVGTKAFMIGTACWRDGTIVTRQLYLTALAGEARMLDVFADTLPSDPVFVSYNGRSYDTPLLKGRYRLHRQLHPFEDRPHVDLLYPTRRAYRGVWENCRLQTIERNLLGIVRDDDLPGSEAPAAWLAFLRGQSSRNLARVLDHNRQDVITLTCLLDRLSGDVAAQDAHPPVSTAPERILREVREQVPLSP